MTDDNHGQQNPSAFANRNAQFNIPTVGRENFHSGFIPSTYGLGQISPSMIPPRSGQNLIAFPEQASPTSPFIASLACANATTNGAWDQPFDPNAQLVTPLYETSNYGQYSPNGYTDTNYGNFNGGPQHFPPATQSATPFIPNQPNVVSSKPYLCSSGCGKSFTRKADMQRHNRLHGPPSLWCNVQGCTKSFYRNDKFQEHIKTHQNH